ncbi:MAG: TolC family protein [Verrucomicrobiales bacterium]
MYSKFIITALLVFSARSLNGADTPVALGPDSAVARALTANKHLHAAQLELRRARVQLYWEGRLDNPELEFAAANDTFGNGEGEATFEIAFVQKFPLTSRLHSAKELRRVQVALAQAEIDERRRTLANQVRSACIEYAATRRKISLYLQLAMINEEIATFLSAVAERGEASRLDVAGARLSGNSLHRESKAATAESERWLGRLRSLLGLKADAELTLDVDLNLPAKLPSLRLNIGNVLIQRPDYQATLIGSNVARAELTLAEAGSLEDLAVKLFAEHERATDDPGGLDDNTMIGIGFSFPLPLRKRNQPAIESARINIAQRRLESDAMALKIENEIAVAAATRNTAFEAARDASGKILELADSNLQGYRDAYSAGQASFTQVQRAQEQKLELEKAALELAREYHLADIALKYATATDPFTKYPARDHTKTPGKTNP